QPQQLAVALAGDVLRLRGEDAAVLDEDGLGAALGGLELDDGDLAVVGGLCGGPRGGLAVRRGRRAGALAGAGLPGAAAAFALGGAGDQRGEVEHAGDAADGQDDTGEEEAHVCGSVGCGERWGARPPLWGR